MRNTFDSETDWKFLKEQLQKVGFIERTKIEMRKDAISFKFVGSSVRVDIYDNKSNVLMSILAPLGAKDDLLIIE